MANNQFQKQMRRRSKRIYDKKLPTSPLFIPKDMRIWHNENEEKLVVDTLCSDPNDHLADPRGYTIELSEEICERYREPRQCIHDVEDMDDRDPQYRYQVERKTGNKKQAETERQRLNKNSYAQLCGVIQNCFEQLGVPQEQYMSLKKKTKEDLLKTLSKSPLKNAIIELYHKRKWKQYIQMSQAERSQKIYNMQACRKIIALAIIEKQVQQKTSKLQ